MLKLFKKKAVKSGYCFTIKSRINMHDKELIQFQYITENYAVIVVGSKIIYFSKEENDYFLINEEKKELKPIDISAQIAQIAQFRTAVGKVEVLKNDNCVKLLNLPTNNYSLKNNSEQVKFSGNIFTSNISNLENTLYSLMRDKEQETNVFNLNFKNNEIVSKMDIKIVLGENEHKQSTEILSIVPIIEDIEKYDNYTTFKIKK